MTFTTKALLARLAIYRDGEEHPAPPPPPPHPRMAADVALARRMELCAKRQKALQDENDELRARLHAASQLSTVPETPLLVGALPLLGYRDVLEECCKVLQSGELKLSDVSFVRYAVARALDVLYALKSFSESFDALDDSHRQLTKEGIQIVLEHHLGDSSLEKGREAATEVLIRFESVEERLTRWADDCDRLQRALRDAVGSAVARAVLHVGSADDSCCCPRRRATSSTALLSAVQEATLEVLNVTNHMETDVSSFRKSFSVADKLMMRLHALSVAVRPQDAMLSIVDLQEMAGGRMQPNLEMQRAMNSSRYDAVERSLQTVLALLDG